MDIAAMLEPTHDAPRPVATSSSSSQSLPRLPAIAHVVPALQQQQQPFSSHQISTHAGIPIEPHSSVPPRRHDPPQRMNSMSSNNSSIHGSVGYTTQPFPSSSSPPTTQRPRSSSTAHRDSSLSPSQANAQPRHRGKQTKAACIPCRKRKSKCDGVRPICKSCITKATPCNYSVTPGMTQQQAMKNQMEAYRHVLSLIRESTVQDAEVLVKMIKARDSLSDAVLDIQKMTQQKY